MSRSLREEGAGRAAAVAAALLGNSVEILLLWGIGDARRQVMTAATTDSDRSVG